MKKKDHVVANVQPGSIAEELELSKGDILISVNGKKIEDVFDYHYSMNEEYLELLIQKPDGEEWELEIEKEYEEDLGLEFENEFMDDYRSCCNKCIFCFIDQMPKGMRETLYFKDDDSRLSFLQGNYVTLTNMSERDVERIINYKLSPINISVQTTNPKLRVKMLNNPNAGTALSKIKRFAEANIVMNGQIVLCKGINDGEELVRTIRDLMEYAPVMESVSVVPVGLSKFREGLYPLESFTKEDAAAVIDSIEEWQKICYEQYGIHFIHASDEWYLLAQRELPEENRYDGYLQLENGVGMLRLLKDEFAAALNEAEPRKQLVRRITIATGLLAAPHITQLVNTMSEKFPNIQVNVIGISNNFFGEKITVAGLITAQDLMEQLKDRDLGDTLLLPCSMLRSGEEVFLDDITLECVRRTLKVKINIVESRGDYLLDSILE
ncbi:MAG: DUF512 domain-containing protein [Lachnospiraceae bacterium]